MLMEGKNGPLSMAKPSSSVVINTRTVSQPPPVRQPPKSNTVLIACRFVPHDQWLLTHLAPHWKIKHVKHHILAKCLGLSFTPPEVPSNIGLNKSGGATEQRPHSPITFAPDPRDRPASPILFAAAKNDEKASQSAEDDDSIELGTCDEEERENERCVEEDIASGDEVQAIRKGKEEEMPLKFEDEHDDDIFDDYIVPDGGGGRVVPSSKLSQSLFTSAAGLSQPLHLHHRSLKDRTTKHTKSPLEPETTTPRTMFKAPDDPKAVPQLAHISFALLRFSTGQILEDEYLVSEYDFAAHELLELHLCIPIPFPGSSTPASLTSHPTPTFPFPLLSAPSGSRNSKSKHKHSQPEFLASLQATRLVSLPRTIPQSYVQPYWEGWVRALRVVWRDEGAYAYSRHGELKDGLMPGYAQYGSPYPGSIGVMSLGAAEYVGEVRESDPPAEVGFGFGFGSSGKNPRERNEGKDGERQDDDGRRHRSRFDGSSGTRLEWRERWVVVRDGWVSLCKDRDDPTPTHQLPLSSLAALRGVEHLAQSTRSLLQKKGGQGARKSRHIPDKGIEKEKHEHHSRGAEETEKLSHKDKDKRQKRGDESGFPTTLMASNSPATASHTISPLQSGYGHGRHKHGHHIHAQRHEDEEYDEDDEDDDRDRDNRARMKRATAHHQHIHQSHHRSHAHLHSHSNTRSRDFKLDFGGLEIPGPRSHDKSKFSTSSIPTARTYIPSTKDEADQAGMKIVCAKFRSVIRPGKGGVRFEPPKDKANTNATEDRRYTSTGPSLSYIAAIGGSGNTGTGLLDVLSGAAGDREREREKEKEREKEREREKEKEREARRRKEVEPHKSRLAPKTSVASSLTSSIQVSSPLNQIDRTRAHINDRRPSLPSLSSGPNGAQPHTIVNLPHSSGVTLNQNPSASNVNAIKGFAAFFGSPRDKEEKRREKEQKRKVKERKELEKEVRRKAKDDDDECIRSGSSWKLAIGKKLKDGELKDRRATGKEVMHVRSVEIREKAQNDLHPGHISSSTAIRDTVAEDVHPYEYEDAEKVMSGVTSPSSDDDGEDEHLSSAESPDDRMGERQASAFQEYTKTSPVLTPRNPVSASVSPSTHSPIPNNAATLVSEVNDLEDESSDSTSLLLSSPVFARSSGSGSDHDLDAELGLSNRRTGYRYGSYYQKGGKTTTAEEQKEAERNHADAEKESGEITKISKQPLPSMKGREREKELPDVPVLAKSNAVGSTGRAGERKRSKIKETMKEKEKGEWIILDLGNDPAYNSLLRIFHRHLSHPMSSTFIPNFASVISPFPTPGHSPANSPASESRPQGFWSTTTGAPAGRSRRSSLLESGLHSPTSTLRNRSHSDAGQLTIPQPRKFRSGRGSDDDVDEHSSLPSSGSPFRSPKPVHPPMLATLIANRHGNVPHRTIHGTLGAPFYPEWRLEIVKRARRAALGVVGRPLELMLLGMGDDGEEGYQLEDPTLYSLRKLKGGTTSRMSKDVYLTEGTKGSESDLGDVKGYIGSDEGEGQHDGDGDDEDDHQGYILNVSDSDEDDGDQSEVEWRGWPADLTRQARLQFQRAALAPVRSSETPPTDQDEDAFDNLPTSPASERMLMMKRMKDMEPCGVITSLYTSTALPGFLAPMTGNYQHHDSEHHRQIHRNQRSRPTTSAGAATLSGPSSTESLVLRRHGSRGTSFGKVNNNPNSPKAFSPIPLSSPHHGHTHSHSQSNISHPYVRPQQGIHQSSLHHSSSMQTSLRTPQDSLIFIQDTPTRRPSMPSIGSTSTSMTEQTFALAPSSLGLVIRELRDGEVTHNQDEMADDFQFVTVASNDSIVYETTTPMASSVSIPISPNSQNYPPSVSGASFVSGSPQNSSILRNQTSGGLGSGSIGRSSSILRKGGLLRKKDSDLGREVENSKDAEKKTREREERSREREEDRGPSQRRPRLSLTTSSAHQVTIASASNSRTELQSPTQSKSPRVVTRSILRRVRSGSSLKSGDEGPLSPTSGGKKKKSGTLDRLVRGLDSALDFADSRR